MLTPKEIESPEKFREDLERRTNIAQSYHDVWAAICGKGLLPHYKDTFNNHFSLTKTIETGLRNAFIVGICSLYDNDARSVTIERYGSHLASQGKITDSWEQNFQSVKEQAKDVQLLRNKYFAHYSEEQYAKNFWKEADVTYKKLTDFMKDTRILMTEMLLIDDGSVFEYNYSPKADLKKVFPKYDSADEWI